MSTRFFHAFDEAQAYARLLMSTGRMRVRIERRDGVGYFVKARGADGLGVATVNSISVDVKLADPPGVAIRTKVSKQGVSKEVIRPPDGGAPRQRFMTAACSCAGENPQCFKCGGWGYLDSIADGRSSPKSLTAATCLVAPRPSGRPGKQKRVHALLVCPQCEIGVRASRLSKHLARVHKVLPRPASATKTSQRRQGAEPSAPLVTRTKDRPPPTSTKGSERNLDATRDYSAAFRDRGQFGSHPSHDGYGDEAEP